MLRWCAVRISHPGGSTPATVMVSLSVDCDGIRPLCFFFLFIHYGFGSLLLLHLLYNTTLLPASSPLVLCSTPPPDPVPTCLIPSPWPRATDLMRLITPALERSITSTVAACFSVEDVRPSLWCSCWFLGREWRVKLHCSTCCVFDVNVLGELAPN